MPADAFVFGFSVGAIIGGTYLFFGLLLLLWASQALSESVDRVIGESALGGVLGLAVWPLTWGLIMLVEIRRRRRGLGGRLL